MDMWFYLESGKEEQLPVNFEEQKTRKTKNSDEQKSGQKVKDLKTLRKEPYIEL